MSAHLTRIIPSPFGGMTPMRRNIIVTTARSEKHGRRVNLQGKRGHVCARPVLGERPPLPGQLPGSDSCLYDPITGLTLERMIPDEATSYLLDLHAHLHEAAGSEGEADVNLCEIKAQDASPEPHPDTQSRSDEGPR